MANCLDEIRNKYIQIPPIPISDNNLPKYYILLDSVIKSTLREYSELRPLYKEKTFTTTDTETQIDIYEKIDENFMDFIIFDEKANVVNGFMIPEVNTFITPIILDSLRGEISFLNIQYLYDNMTLIKEYFENKYRKYVFNDKYIKVKPNTEYYVLYEAYRTEEDILNKDCRSFEELLGINLMINILDSYMFNDEQPIRSVSISGISVTFNVENKETVRRVLLENKERIRSRFVNIYEYVSRF